MKIRGHPVHNRPVRPPVFDAAPSWRELPTRLLTSHSTGFQTLYRPNLGLCGQALSVSKPLAPKLHGSTGRGFLFA